MKRLARDGHTVTLITAQYNGSKADETIDGVRILRSGGRYSVYLRARSQYRKHFPSQVDLVIDEMNTIPFVAATYTKSTQHVLLAYQLAREVWFYQMPPIVSHIGYMVEPLYVRLLGRIYHTTITESQSSKKDFLAHGLRNVKVFRVGMELKPIESLLPKPPTPTVLSLGAVRPMKRTLDAVKSFEVARDANQTLRMAIAGDIAGTYGDRVRHYIDSSRHKDAIEILGRVSSEKKLDLMRTSNVILVTSVKEGWGLIVTEANSQGTPAIVYDVDGLRDSVQHNQTGVVVANNDYHAMGKAINELVSDSSNYEQMRSRAWESSRNYSFEDSYLDFCAQLDIPVVRH